MAGSAPFPGSAATISGTAKDGCSRRPLFSQAGRRDGRSPQRLGPFEGGVDVVLEPLLSCPMPSGADASGHLDVRVVLRDADVEISEDQLQHIQEDLRAVAAGRLYANRQVSIGKAAELCGLTVAELVEKLAEWHMPVIQYPIDQLRHDLVDR